MLEKFWREKKPILEITGFIFVVGSFFLGIPSAENSDANSALVNLKLFWFSLMILVTFILTSTFLSFINKSVKEMWFGSGLAWGLVAVDIWFSINLWNYFIALYEKPLNTFVQDHYPLVLIFSFIFISNKIDTLKEKISPFIYAAISGVPLAALASILPIYVGRFWNLFQNLESWGVIYLTLYFIFLLFSYYKIRLQKPR